MILEDATFEAFGYYPSDLTPQTHKRILAYCEICGEFKVTRKNGYHTLCKSCSHKGKTLTEEAKRKIGEGNKGKTLTDESKRKISKAQKGHTVTEEAKRKMSEAHKGKKNYNWKGGKKARVRRKNAKRRKLEYIILMPLKPGEVGHHITDKYVIGIQEEVHRKLVGRRKKHRTKILQWLKTNDKKKYKLALCILAKEQLKKK